MDTNALDANATNRRNKRRRALLAILLASSLATLGAGAMSLAVFTDTDASGGAWDTGTIILGVSPAAAFTATDILPGDSGNRTLNVANTGTGDMRYSLAGSATNADSKGLADQLNLTIQAGTCAAPGATLYSGALSGAAFGDNTVGADAGDRDVLAGASENLCFSWDLPLGTGNAFQDAATTATFTFDAEQTKNN